MTSLCNGAASFRVVKHINNDDVLRWLRETRLRAYTPGSGYSVAAAFAVKTNTGYVLASGVNVECLEHRLSVHGEGSALAALATVFGKSFCVDAGWTLGAPAHLTEPCHDPLADQYGYSCGACRQQIFEFISHPDMLMHSFTLNGACKTKALGTLLPDGFSFAHIRNDISKECVGPLDIDNIDNIQQRLCQTVDLNDVDIFHWLKDLESIDYASNIAHSVVLRLLSGAFVAGVKIENAAYVGQGAVQSAIGNAVTLFGPIKITGVYSLTRRTDRVDDSLYPLPLSALQSLGEFVSDHTIPVTLFASSGKHKTMTYAESGSVFSSFQQTDPLSGSASG